MILRTLYRLRFFGRSALQGLRASPLTSAVAVLTIAVTLLLGGIFVLLLGNMGDVARRFDAELVVRGYLDPALDPEAERALAEQAGAIEGVAMVTLVSKDEALARFEAGIGQQLGLAEAFDENPLPASLELSLAPAARSGAALHRVADALAELPGIAEIGQGQAWVEGYARMLGLLRAAGWGFGAVLGLATLLIVANTIRLAVYARRDEIEIQGLVGASRSFIAVPFLLEGLMQGVAGGALALLVLLALFVFVLPGAEQSLQLVLGFSRPRFLAAGELSLLVAAGATLGVLGSAAALGQGWRR